MAQNFRLRDWWGNRKGKKEEADEPPEIEVGETPQKRLERIREVKRRDRLDRLRARAESEERREEEEDEEEFPREEALERYRERVRRKNREDESRAKAENNRTFSRRNWDDEEEEKRDQALAREMKKSKKANFSLRNLFSRFSKKKNVDVSDYDYDMGDKKSKFSMPKLDNSSQMFLLVGVVAVILVVLFRFTTPVVLPQSIPVQRGQAVKPLVQPVVPLDLKNSDWITPIQQVLLAEAIAFLFLTIADARRRSQLSDAAAVIIGIVIIFAPTIPLPGDNNLGVLFKAFGFEGTSSVVLATVLVVWSSLAGGRDFTPLGCYFGCIGLGGLLTGSLGEISVMFHLDPASSAMSVNQIVNLLVTKAPGNVALSIWIDLFLLAAFGTLLYEVFRPTAMTQQGDSGPSMGSLLSMVLGIAAYLIVRLGLYQEPPVSFIASLSSVLAVGAMTQYEKLPQFIPGKWSVRTMFDPAMLMVSGLALFHVLTGIA